MNLERLKRQLVQHEGTGPVRNGRFFPYRCPAGKLTIGIGRNLDDVGISEAEAEFMLENDIAAAVEDCRRLFPVFDTLDDVRQEVLANMMFNMGYAKFSGFKRMIAAVNAGNYEEAARQMGDSAWYHQTKKRAQDLQRMMLTGVIEGG